MRKLLVLMSLALCWACKPATPAEIQEVTETASVTTTTTEVPFAGSWVAETYYNSIQKNKSPRVAQELVDECYIHILPSKHDTAYMGYNFHEIGPKLRLVEENGKYAYWAVQGDSLHARAFTIEHPDPEHLLLNDVRFVKINATHIQNLPLVLEAILFKGKYKNSDGGEVVFTEDGVVTGLDNFTKYHVRTDYMDAGLQIDQVGFKADGVKPVFYGFTYKGDVLELYEIRCLERDAQSGACQHADFGKKLYTLTRIAS
jgi:hypothetical protein